MEREPTEMEMIVARAIATAYEARIDRSRPTPHDTTPEQRGFLLSNYWLEESRASTRAICREVVRGVSKAAIQAHNSGGGSVKITEAICRAMETMSPTID